MKEKKLKLYFCPKCKSRDVGYIFTIGNIFGIIPRMRCNNCGFESPIFPIMIIDVNKLEKNHGKRRKSK